MFINTENYDLKELKEIQEASYELGKKEGKEEGVEFLWGVLKHVCENYEDSDAYVKAFDAWNLRESVKKFSDAGSFIKAVCDNEKRLEAERRANDARNAEMIEKIMPSEEDAENRQETEDKKRRENLIKLGNLIQPLMDTFGYTLEEVIEKFEETIR